MKRPKLGLFSRLFGLFSITTILLGFCLAAATQVFSESRAKSLIEERHDKLVDMLLHIENKATDDAQLKEVAEKVKGEVLLNSNGIRRTTDSNFPKIDELLDAATPIGELNFVKLQGEYYLLHKSGKSWIAVTSNPMNYVIYPWWAVFWPWLGILLILVISYWILRRLLRPIFKAVDSVKAISTGNFSEKIPSHPKNELAELTRGINKMADELKGMFDAKNELLLAISHELRTPLARMRISLAMLEKTDAVKDIDDDLSQMDLLIGQLLEGERLEDGHKALHLQTTYLPTLLDEILSEKDMAEKASLATAVPEIALDVDAGRIKFTIRNLLLNAIKHNSADTQVALHTTLENDFLNIRVSDSGTGISEDALPHLFEPFYCVNNSENRDTKGTGLGLYLCKKIALAHNGDLQVESQLDKGSSFILSLPYHSE